MAKFQLGLTDLDPFSLALLIFMSQLLRQEIQWFGDDEDIAEDAQQHLTLIFEHLIDALGADWTLRIILDSMDGVPRLKNLKSKN
jgi:hypothetical protein